MSEANPARPRVEFLPVMNYVGYNKATSNKVNQNYKRSN